MSLKPGVVSRVWIISGWSEPASAKLPPVQAHMD